MLFWCVLIFFTSFSVVACCCWFHFVGFSLCLTISIVWEDPQKSMAETQTKTTLTFAAQMSEFHRHWRVCSLLWRLWKLAQCGQWSNLRPGVHMLGLDGFGTSKGGTTRKLWNWPCVVKMMISGLMIEFRSILASDKRSTWIQLLGGLRLKCQIENSLCPSKLTWSHMQPPTIGIDVAKGLHWIL